MYRAVEATRDILPGDVEQWQSVEDTARDLFDCYGFREIRTPIFEFTELFARSVGAETDIVSKEMYTFTDRGRRSLTLRPEGTAPIVRAYVEHRVHKTEDITRWYYLGPMFRYERKQRGRYRQFSQIGAEILGTDAPEVDAEVIEMVMHFLDVLGVRGCTLHLNSLGCSECRTAFRDVLAEALAPEIGSYCENCQRRFKENVLRVLDCKLDRDRVQRLPTILERLCPPCRQHFERVQEVLKSLGVGFRIEPHLVRGLDYYMRTAFEVTAEGLGAQNAVLGGGRYDGLVAQLGGPDVPGFGFAVGLDRLVMAVADEVRRDVRPDVAIILVTADDAADRARRLAVQMRHEELRVTLDPAGRSVKAQMRRADKSGARFALVFGTDELASGKLTLKRLADGQEVSYAMDDLEALVDDVKHARR